MAHQVFVSHSAKDKEVASKVVAHLEEAGLACWVAPRDVVPGADWGESIIDAIESSRVMVLIFSSNANNSSQIKREVERAVDKDVYTIPFRIDDIEPTRSLEYFISSSQWMDAFTPPLEQHLDKLARTVQAIIARVPEKAVLKMEKPVEPLVPVEIPPPLPPRPVPPRWVKPALIGGGVLLLGVLAYFFLFHPSPPP
ncbi:MAG: toll/interleukin-1 receptor domain-containing protein, partial [Verrucomicrobiota bacterium]|nr:toll/interleukin-1 receptor domain-containing protein [Verrucomicrobiota bacterium]